MFYITMGKGFQIEYANKWRISVQFGWMNYCANHDSDMPEPNPREHKCEDAEVAVFNSKDEFVRGWPHCDDSDDVQGHLTSNQVLEIMNWTAAQSCSDS